MRWNSIVQALMLASMATAAFPLHAAEPLPLLLAGVEHGQADVALYLVSEKIDGVRAFWDGQALRTRHGNPINAPAWFIANFPAQSLDSELWIGRGQFDRLSATVRRHVPNEPNGVKYAIWSSNCRRRPVPFANGFRRCEV